jgi:hypothetical protein
MFYPNLVMLFFRAESFHLSDAIGIFMAKI